MIVTPDHLGHMIYNYWSGYLFRDFSYKFRDTVLKIVNSKAACTSNFMVKSTPPNNS